MANMIVPVEPTKSRRFYHPAGLNGELVDTVLPALCNLIFDNRQFSAGKSLSCSDQLTELFRASVELTEPAARYLDIRQLSGGRGGSFCVTMGSDRFACKQYLRGGLPGRFNRSRYLWSGWHRTRALRELQLLVDCQTLGLPAARPVFCAVHRSVFFYRAVLLTRWLDEAPTLADLLTQRPLLEAEWQRLASMLLAFFAAGIMHPDLNATNILFEHSRHPILIDFDRAARCNPQDPTWQVGMLKRLRRSLLKLQSAEIEFHYSDETDWALLLTAIEHMRAADAAATSDRQ